jgi:DNA-binding transcriptional ArsR family regulator
MDVDISASRIAAAIGEPARARMLYCLMDNRARTSTELAVVAEVSPSTASVHLSRLKAEGLVKLEAQGKHRYYSLMGPRVARVLEGLSVLAGAQNKFVPSTPSGLRAARTCYDHAAGALGVGLHDRLRTLGYLTDSYDALRPAGAMKLAALGLELEPSRRRFAYGCLDWSERRPHIGGALGSGLLKLILKRKWAIRELDSRALRVTPLGEREMFKHFGLSLHS